MIVLQLIDAKINNDMREVIAELKRLESKIDMLDDKLSTEIKTIYWVIGIAMTVILFMISKK
jgi:uncharacterized protein Yka (UPF0111/DUF47 family)